MVIECKASWMQNCRCSAAELGHRFGVWMCYDYLAMVTITNKKGQWVCAMTLFQFSSMEYYIYLVNWSCHKREAIYIYIYIFLIKKGQWVCCQAVCRPERLKWNESSIEQANMAKYFGYRGGTRRYCVLQLQVL